MVRDFSREVKADKIFAQRFAKNFRKLPSSIKFQTYCKRVGQRPLGTTDSIACWANALPKGFSPTVSLWLESGKVIEGSYLLFYIIGREGIFTFIDSCYISVKSKQKGDLIEMVKLDIAKLRPKLDLEGKYVDFNTLRTALSVQTIVRDLEINLTEAAQEGECRATCPKCKKQRSFALNINTNRFNCFTKGCFLKGGGVIDFVGKLFEIPAKEASHFLACAYGIQPYSPEPVSESKPAEKTVSEKPPAQTETAPPDRSREVVSREEFDALEKRFERLSYIVWSLLFESGEIKETDVLFDELPDHEMKTFVSG